MKANHNIAEADTIERRVVVYGAKINFQMLAFDGVDFEAVQTGLIFNYGEFAIIKNAVNHKDYTQKKMEKHLQNDSQLDIFVAF